MKRLPPEFVAKICHDMKSPVGNAMIYSELLIDDIENLQSEHKDAADDLDHLKHYCRNIHLSSSKLINTIQSWGFAYQIEDGIYEASEDRVHVKKLLEQTISGNEIFIRGKSLNVNLEYESDVNTVKTDEELITLVLDNLVTLFLSIAGNKKTIDIRVSDDNGKLLFLFFPPETAFRSNLIEAFSGEQTISNNMVPEQGILKPGGYALLFVNTALRFLGADHGVDQESGATPSFWFRLPLS